MFIVSKYLIPKGYSGLTFFPFVILKYKSSKNDLITINHEKIHIRQQLELLILPFYIWYFGNLFYNYLKYRNFQKAYRNIIFEREAYANEKDLDYLKSRSLWRFLHYF
ncbi:hypothetical protein [Flavobacterium sp.]|uniref:hypothetical protein n=1 Tax=Flavobacterium sp. TaxID=239 RepID=UPI00286C482A|nr:hypothetical protein [Flavobacterium sp.]